MSDLAAQLEEWASKELDRDEVRALLAADFGSWSSLEDDAGGRWHVHAQRDVIVTANGNIPGLSDCDARYASPGLTAAFVCGKRGNRASWHVSEWQLVTGELVPTSLVPLLEEEA